MYDVIFSHYLVMLTNFVLGNNNKYHIIFGEVFFLFFCFCLSVDFNPDFQMHTVKSHLVWLVSVANRIFSSEKHTEFPNPVLLTLNGHSFSFQTLRGRINVPHANVGKKETQSLFMML